MENDSSHHPLIQEPRFDYKRESAIARLAGTPLENWSSGSYKFWGSLSPEERERLDNLRRIMYSNEDWDMLNAIIIKNYRTDTPLRLTPKADSGKGTPQSIGNYDEVMSPKMLEQLLPEKQEVPLLGPGKDYPGSKIEEKSPEKENPVEAKIKETSSQPMEKPQDKKSKGGIPELVSIGAMLVGLLLGGGTYAAKDSIENAAESPPGRALLQKAGLDEHFENLGVIDPIHLGIDVSDADIKDLETAFVAMGGEDIAAVPVIQSDFPSETPDVSPTATKTVQPTLTTIPTQTKESISSPTSTSTNTPTTTATNTLTPTSTKTTEPTNTKTNSPTPTSTNTNTPEPTNTPTPSNTVIPITIITETFTPSPTNTNTSNQTPTNTFTAKPTATNTPSLTPTQTATNTFTATSTETNMPTQIPTNISTQAETATEGTPILEVFDAAEINFDIVEKIYNFSLSDGDKRFIERYIGRRVDTEKEISKEEALAEAMILINQGTGGLGTPPSYMSIGARNSTQQTMIDCMFGEGNWKDLFDKADELQSSLETLAPTIETSVLNIADSLMAERKTYTIIIAEENGDEEAIEIDQKKIIEIFNGVKVINNGNIFADQNFNQTENKFVEDGGFTKDVERGHYGIDVVPSLDGYNRVLNIFQGEFYRIYSNRLSGTYGNKEDFSENDVFSPAIVPVKEDGTYVTMEVEGKEYVFLVVYGHVYGFQSNFEEGEVIVPGRVIGDIQKTAPGSSQGGAHLHLELRLIERVKFEEVKENPGGVNDIFNEDEKTIGGVLSVGATNPVLDPTLLVDLVELNNIELTFEDVTKSFEEIPPTPNRIFTGEIDESNLNDMYSNLKDPILEYAQEILNYFEDKSELNNHEARIVMDILEIQSKFKNNEPIVINISMTDLGAEGREYVTADPEKSGHIGRSDMTMMLIIDPIEGIKIVQISRHQEVPTPIIHEDGSISFGEPSEFQYLGNPIVDENGRNVINSDGVLQNHLMDGQFHELMKKITGVEADFSMTMSMGVVDQILESVFPRGLDLEVSENYIFSHDSTIINSDGTTRVIDGGPITIYLPDGRVQRFDGDGNISEVEELRQFLLENSMKDIWDELKSTGKPLSSATIYCKGKIHLGPTDLLYLLRIRGDQESTRGEFAKSLLTNPVNAFELLKAVDDFDLESANNSLLNAFGKNDQSETDRSMDYQGEHGYLWKMIMLGLINDNETFTKDILSLLVEAYTNDKIAQIYPDLQGFDTSKILEEIQAEIVPERYIVEIKRNIQKGETVVPKVYIDWVYNNNLERSINAIPNVVYIEEFLEIYEELADEFNIPLQLRLENVREVAEKIEDDTGIDPTAIRPGTLFFDAESNKFVVLEGSIVIASAQTSQ